MPNVLEAYAARRVVPSDQFGLVVIAQHDAFGCRAPDACRRAQRDRVRNAMHVETFLSTCLADAVDTFKAHECWELGVIRDC